MSPLAVSFLTGDISSSTSREKWSAGGGEEGGSERGGERGRAGAPVRSPPVEPARSGGKEGHGEGEGSDVVGRGKPKTARGCGDC